MVREASLKVPDGKLLKLEIDEDEGEVIQARLRGDFFIEPPEALEDIEKALTGIPIDQHREDIIQNIQEVDARLIGFSASDLADVFSEAAGGMDD